jgi:hypothetical protein
LRGHNRNRYGARDSSDNQYSLEWKCVGCCVGSTYGRTHEIGLVDRSVSGQVVVLGSYLDLVFSGDIVGSKAGRNRMTIDV